jgi:hypothetical protein
MSLVEIQSCIVRTVEARKAKGGNHHAVGTVCLALDRLSLHRPRVDGRLSVELFPRNATEQALYLSEHGHRLHIADDHQDDVVRGVPAVIVGLEHRTCRLIEGSARPQGVMGNGTAVPASGVCRPRRVSLPDDNHQTLCIMSQAPMAVAAWPRH